MKSLEVNKISKQEEKIILHISEPLTAEEASTLNAAGRMLADSDHIAFIYLLEDDNSYRYVKLPEELWSELLVAMKQTHQVYIELAQNFELKCTAFKEELDYLLDNIEGNSNYGEQMIEAVERLSK